MGAMKFTEELSIIAHEALASLKSLPAMPRMRRGGKPTMMTPHNSISVESQMLGRSLLRSTLLGAYQARSELGGLAQREGEHTSKNA